MSDLDRGVVVEIRKGGPMKGHTGEIALRDREGRPELYAVLLDRPVGSKTLAIVERSNLIRTNGDDEGPPHD